ncbi:MAG: hypothetical protein HY903_06475 [Deltaproteobacteria bacterium]|nr:hypothetical protein [Deltaproteobacteria bacterium]
MTDRAGLSDDVAEQIAAAQRAWMEEQDPKALRRRLFDLLRFLEGDEPR